MNVLIALFPIVLLIYMMVRKKSIPSAKALPLTAFVTYLIVLIFFRFEGNLVHANVLKGLLLAWTPILIIAGAIFLFKTLEVTGGLDVLRRWLNGVTSNKVSQLMIVGWAFPFLIEGASGFGTPAAIAAPILVGLGFPPVRVAILTLVMNSVPVAFGAIGTPIWFGFSEISLTEAEILIVSFKTAILNSSAGIVIPGIALMFILKPKTVIRNYLFIFLSTISTLIPFIILAKYNYEFPSLMGGAVGLLITVFLAKKGIGLSKKEILLQESLGESNLLKHENEHAGKKNPGFAEIIRASFPLWGTILLLLLTRIPELGLKDLLTATAPNLKISMGTLGDLMISPSLVIQLENIFGTPESWAHSLLYVPSIIPFGLVSLIALWMNRGVKDSGIPIFRETVTQMYEPTLALLGALVFVSLMMMGGEKSAVTIIGNQLAAFTGNSWQFFSSFLGALGSFFSGSATISNLTFGGIQDSIAGSLNLDRTSILAMQSAGASMGNMVCINNIVAVASILALGNKEG
ncbi:MAG: L-lactate permease, partial [Bacteroidales bacterium]